MATTYSELPFAWSNKNKIEKLTPAAYSSLSRMIPRAVAETNVNFNLTSALRTKAEQVALFKANYRNRGTKQKQASSDRMYNGTAWRHVTNVAVASPDLYGTGTGANHTRGIAIDIIPAGIQSWIQRNGGRFGWDWSEGKRNKEPWHFVYVSAQDKYKSEGTLNHAAVQRVVGASPIDGKIGTGTVKLIKAFQKKHGLDVDGKVGPATKAAMGLGKGDDTPSPSPPTPSTPSTAVSTYTLDQKKSPNAYSDRKGHKIKHITIHWWGTPVGQKRDGIIAWLTNPTANVSAHYVVTAGHVTQLVDESAGSWANGNKTANLESVTIECNPNDPAGTLPTVAALVRDIRKRHGDLPIYPHQRWVSTECPGAYVALLPALDILARGGSADLGKPTSPTKTTLTVDGRWGTATSSALQRYLNKYHSAKLTTDGRAAEATWRAFQKAVGAPHVDGKISRQSYKPAELGNGIVDRKSAWEYTGRGSKGSQTISLMQNWAKTTRDGVLFEGTTRAVQTRLNTYDLG